jgi:Flp pilus assembly protein TadD
MTHRADELFNQAHHAIVVDENGVDAVKLCREALEAQPDHFRARMLLGALLGDSQDPTMREEARRQFLVGLQQLKTAQDLKDLLIEEDPVNQFATWYYKQGDAMAAALLWLIDYFVGASDNRDRALRLTRESLSARRDLQEILSVLSLE